MENSSVINSRHSPFEIDPIFPRISLFSFLLEIRNGRNKCNKSVSRAQRRVRPLRLDARRFRRIFGRLKKRRSCLFFFKDLVARFSTGRVERETERERESRFIIVASVRSLHSILNESNLIQN